MKHIPTIDVAAHDWWVELYDEFLAEALLVRGDEAALEQTLDFLCEELELDLGARVFDQCCGIGSLAVPLAAERGMVVVGVDQAAAYIDRARADAAAVGAAAEFIHDDAFTYRCTPPADAALNWWTSYGYAETPERNRHMLARAFDSLRPGGRFALDVPNLPGVLRHFEADRVDERETPLGRISMRRESEVDLAGGRLLKTWAFSVDGERRASHRSSLELAMPGDHVRALEGVGFRLLGCHGGVDRAPLSLDSPRCILVAERPA